MKKLSILIFTLCMSCAGIDTSNWHFPYMMEVQQGSSLTSNEIDNLKPGMTKDQVAFLLQGAFVDAFENNTWNLVYQDYKNDSLVRQYLVIVYFDDHNLLTSVVRKDI